MKWRRVSEADVVNVIETPDRVESSSDERINAYKLGNRGRGESGSHLYFCERIVSFVELVPIKVVGLRCAHPTYGLTPTADL